MDRKERIKVRDAKRRIEKMLPDYFTSKELLDSLKHQKSQRLKKWEEDNETLLASITEADQRYKKYNTAIRAAISNIYLFSGEQEIMDGVTVQLRWGTEVVGTEDALVIWCLEHNHPEMLQVNQKALKDFVKEKVIRESVTDEDAEVFLDDVGLEGLVKVKQNPTPVIKNVSVAT
jgi:hypothetical protein